MLFEFDPVKSAANAAKHGIDFLAAQAIWADERAAVIAARSETEPRWLIVGQAGEAIWSAVFTLRGERVRIISVRRARENEREIYLGG